MGDAGQGGNREQHDATRVENTCAQSENAQNCGAVEIIVRLDDAQGGFRRQIRFMPEIRAV
jgi:hypothetical protein